MNPHCTGPVPCIPESLLPLSFYTHVMNFQKLTTSFFTHVFVHAIRLSICMTSLSAASLYRNQRATRICIFAVPHGIALFVDGRFFASPTSHLHINASCTSTIIVQPTCSPFTCAYSLLGSLQSYRRHRLQRHSRCRWHQLCRARSCRPPRSRTWTFPSI